jgi:hypothetical protein
MKTFIELFTDARSISTPLVAVRTFDPRSTILTVKQSLGEEASTAPSLTWDSITGLTGVNDAGTDVLTEMLAESSTDRAATIDLPTALGVVATKGDAKPHSDLIIFIHNPQLVWETDKKVIQGIINLRNDYRAYGNMLVLLIGMGDTLPIENQQDVMVLEESLPTREELAKIITNTFADASQNVKYAACKNAATLDVLKAGTDALIGLPVFPAGQATGMSLDKVKGVLDMPTLWSRKREIVSQNPGLSYHSGGETLKDLYGCEQFTKFGTRLMGGKYEPTVVIRVDEIQRQLSGSEGETSGTKGNLMGEFLTWVNDKKVICTLNLGVPGTSKSWAPYCIAGEHNKPVINYSIPAMENQYVGNSSKHMRNAHRVLESISDCRIWLIASANRTDGLPPELISRFQVGGIFFFDAPDDDEKRGIMKLKIARYGLEPNQPYPDMGGWTGRDIEYCAMKADALNLSLVEAGEFVVPLLTSHAEEMDRLRTYASGRFLSASKSGVYQYTKRSTKHAPTTTIVEERKFR